MNSDGKKDQPNSRASVDEKMLERLQEAAQVVLFLDASVIAPDDHLESVLLFKKKKPQQKSAFAGQSEGMHEQKQEAPARVSAFRPSAGYSMQVVLLEHVAKLGQMGEVVSVKQGFARNFLLPQGKALRATKANVDRFENQRAQLEARNLVSKGEAEKLAEKLDGQNFIVIRSAVDSGALYGSVTGRDAAEVATAKGFSIDKIQVVLAAPIKELGLYDMNVVLHPEVSATITINVARSTEEAELQASGKSFQELLAEANAEADFDIAELFDDNGWAVGDDENEEAVIADEEEGEGGNASSSP